MLNFPTFHVGVAILVQQTLLGGKTSSVAINLDGTAFKHHWMLEDGNPQQRRDLLCDPVVFFVGRILSTPTIENPIVKSERIGWRVSFHKCGSIVSHPNIYGRNSENRDILHRHPGMLQSRCHIPLRWLVVDQQRDLLAWSQCLNHLHPDTPDFFQLSRPGFEVMRPRKPRRSVARPLRRHGIAEGTRGISTRCNYAHDFWRDGGLLEGQHGAWN